MLTTALKFSIRPLITLVIISIAAFAVQSSVGDPVIELLGPKASLASQQAVRSQLGLDAPLITQYLRFAQRALTGDFGVSFFSKASVTSVIAARIPATLELVIAAALLIIAIALPLGAYCGLRPRSLLARVCIGLCCVATSVPVFVTSILLIYVCSVYWHWLPSHGRGDVVMLTEHLWGSGLLSADGIRHLILPALSLASTTIPLFIRLISSEFIEIMRTDYIAFAQARGLRRRRIIWVHALKNATPPLLAMGGIQFGMMVAFALLTESVFQWPGLGSLFLEAVDRSDGPIIVAYIILVGAMFIIINGIVDLLQGRLTAHSQR